MSLQEVKVYEIPDKGPKALQVADDLPVLAEGASAAAGETLPADFPRGATLQADGSVILKLRYPVSLKFRDAMGAVTAENYSEFHMRRFNGRRLREVQGAPESLRAAQMLASATGLSLGKAEILHDEMDAVDIAAVMRVGLFFIVPGRPTGR